MLTFLPLEEIDTMEAGKAHSLTQAKEILALS